MSTNPSAYIRAYMREWRKTRPSAGKSEYMRAYMAEWRRLNSNYEKPEVAATRKKNRLARQYGITPEELVKMAELQGGKCAICFKKVKLVIDHSHSSGKVRGLLCSPCNLGIGCLNEDIEVIERAATYLRAV